jgi:hypothetical protein
MKFAFTFSLLLILLSASIFTKAQTLDRNIVTTNGPVYSTVQSGDTVYVGGSFDQMGYSAKKFARFTNGSTRPDFNFPQLDPNSSLYAIEPDGKGGYYLGGYIHSYNGTMFYPESPFGAGVIHILSDYSLDPAFTPTNLESGGNSGYVQCLKKRGNRLYIGGSFGSVNGTSRSYLAVLNAATGVLDNWTPDAPDGLVDVVDASDSLVYIHGDFAHLGTNYLQGHFAALKTTTGKYVKYFTAGGDITGFKINNNKLYLGGTFNELGYSAVGLAKVSSTTAAPDFNFPEANGPVYAVLADGSGGYYIGGNFNAIGGVSTSSLAHILADGTVDPAFNVEVNSEVDCLVTDGANLYFAGWFNSVNNTARAYAAAVNRITGALTAWNPNPNGLVRTLLRIGSTVYMGGDFTTVKGSTRNYAAAVTTANTLTSWNPKPDWQVLQLIANTNGTSIFMAGNFTTVNGLTRPYIVKVNTTTGTPAAWAPTPDGGVNSMALNGSKLYLGGRFSSITNISRLNFAEIDTSSNSPTTFQADANNEVLALSIYNGKLYVGGYFTQFKNVDKNYSARIDLTTKTMDSWNPGLNSYLHAIAGTGSNIIIGGDFNLVNSAARQTMAVIDINTNQLTNFSQHVPSLSGSIYTFYFSGKELFAGGSFDYYSPDFTHEYRSIMSIDTTTGIPTRYFDYTPWYNVYGFAVVSNKLYVGGSFPGLNDFSTVEVKRNNLVTYSLSTNKLTNEIYEPNAGVRSLVPDGSGGVIAAGDFSLTNFVNRQYLGAINLKTGLATNWNPKPDGYVNSMAIKDSSLFIGGQFGNIYNSDGSNGKQRAYLAAISTKTGVATGWNADANSYVESVAIADTILYVGGDFSTIKGVVRSYAAAIGTGGTGSVKAFAPNPDNTVKSILPVGSNVYLGGFFGTVKGTARPYLASVTKSTGSLNSWNPNPDNSVYTLIANNTTLYVGGIFGNIASQRRQTVAAFNISSNTLTSFDPRVSSRSGYFTGNSYNYPPYIYGLAQFGKTLFIGSDGGDSHSMDSIKGTVRHVLGAADTTTGNATAFNPNPNNTVHTLKAGTSKLFVGGDYSSMGTSTSASYFSVFSLQPLVQTSNLTFTNLQSTSVTANWTKGSGEGRIVIVKQGSAAGAPSDGVGYNPNAAFGQGSNINGSYVVYKDAGSSINITKLLPNHTYYFAVYEYNGSGSGTEYLQTPVLTGSITTPCPVYTNIISPAGPVTFCQGDSAVLTAIAGMRSYKWSTGATTRSITVKASGSYTVAIADSNACSATSSPLLVTVNAKPTPTTTPSGNVTITSGSSTNIKVNESYNAYLWSTGTTTQSITVNTAGSYTATVTNSNGCKGTTAPVKVSLSSTCPKPAITASGSTTNLCPGTMVTLTASTGTGYLWNTGATTQKITVSAAGAYYVAVTQACGKVTSDTTKVTYQSCGNPTGLVVSNVTATSVRLSWAGVTCGTKYNLQYKVSSATTWTTVAVKGIDTTITGLAPNTTYNWRVQTVCTTPMSGFTNGNNFKTAASLIATTKSMQVQGSFEAIIYPNPASTDAVLSIKGTYKPVTITISDLAGKIIWKTSNIASTRMELPVANLTSGVYIIFVTNGNETKTLKLVKGQQ